MVLCEAIEAEPCAWSPQIAAECLQIASGPEVAAWRENVEAGAWQALEVRQAGERVGHVLLMVEETALGPEMVIVSGVGRGMDLLGEFMPRVERYAESLGCKSVRFHTKRPGLMKRGQEQHGYGFAEAIYRKVL